MGIANLSGMSPQSESVTNLLRAYYGGDISARDSLVETIHAELRTMARRLLSRHGRHNVMVQPTGVADEVAMRLLAQREPLRNRGQLMGLAHLIMQRLLIDEDRREGRKLQASPLADESNLHPGIDTAVTEFAALHEALAELEQFSPDAAEVLTLRAVLGCTIDETAEAIGVAHATVERRWKIAREWLAQRLH